jgi:MutS-like protein
VQQTAHPIAPAPPSELIREGRARPPDDSPQREYAQRLHRAQAEALRLAELERRISNARMVVFLAAIAVAWSGSHTGWWSAWWAGLPIGAFIGLVIAHDRVIRGRQRADRTVRFYEAGMARLEDRWAGTGEGGERFAEAHHPYAADLDVFGHGSLFELLCTARTRGGEETLARWLLSPAAADEVRRRQTGVAELRPRLDLREEVALLGEDIRASIDPRALAAWGAAPAVFTQHGLQRTALGLVVLTAAAGVAWIAGAGPLPLACVSLVEAALAAWLHRRVDRVIRSAQHPDRELALLAELLSRLERETFVAPWLVQRRAALDTHGDPPSRRIARLHRLIHLLDARKNQLFAPFSGLLLWGTQLALAIDAWRVENGASIDRWLTVIGEMEALSALARHAFEHPGDPFPDIVEGPCRFEAVGLGHALLPEARCVRNDVQLGDAPRVLVVSGSNMSGKSTLLRSVGTNAVLAFAGAPVRARSLRLSPLSLGASIRTLDSLQEGTSRFYAEITRLRQLMEIAATAPPLLFLLDEILHGTNSHDRGIGAEAIVRGFLQRGAIGLVTTHDLALAAVADALAPQTANVHFEDHLEDGVMRFDYRLQPGVVTHSNALALMRSVGLEV